MSVCGIYKIVNKINGKVYVGSSVNVEDRWKRHKRDLYKNKHHSVHLQRSWNEYGEYNFEIEIIEECIGEKLEEREQYWLDEYRSFEENVGYNVSKSSNNPMRGRKHKKETIDKIKEKLKGKNCGSDNPMYGKVFSNEHRERLRENNSKYWLGKNRSEITKEKISKSLNGRNLTDEHKKNIKLNHSDRRGEKHHLSKLIWEIVNKIRECYESGLYSQKQLSEIYDIDASQIFRIVNNKVWIKEKE